tara:strand:+ start:225 stop:1853 length:1629 start_codon:yes stop_codon:yes gene_type:complete
MAQSQYTPFPTFGGPKDGGGIMDVKLSPSPMRFPTARRPAPRRTPEPTTKEKLGGLAPFALEGIMGMFKDTPELKSREDYLKNTAVDATNPTKLEKAKADAYTLFGEPEEKPGFGLNEIVNILAASQMGRGAKDYGTSFSAIRKAKETSRLTKEGQRASFIQKQIAPDAFQFLNLQDTEKAKTGIVDIRPGYFDKESGLAYIKDPKNEEANEFGFVAAGKNWIDPAKLASTGSTAVDMYNNPQYKELIKKDVDFSNREQAVGSFLNVANPTVTTLKESLNDPSRAPTTFVSNLMTIGNSALTNFEQIASLNGDRAVTDFFDENVGNSSKQLYLALKDGSDDAINQATTAYEQSSGVNLRELMGPASYDNVSVRANFLQMAYMAAAANGQTGRTLSDKDLAYHLQIIGYGSTQDPEVLFNNILRFGDSLITGLDTETQLGIPKSGFQRYDMSDPTFQSIITRMYTPSMTKNAEGKNVPQWLSYGDYTYKPFLERSAGIGNIDDWVTHEGTFYNRKLKSTIASQTVDSNTNLDKDIEAIQNLYK